MAPALGGIAFSRYLGPFGYPLAILGLLVGLGVRDMARARHGANSASRHQKGSSNGPNWERGAVAGSGSRGTRGLF